MYAMLETMPLWWYAMVLATIIILIAVALVNIYGYRPPRQRIDRSKAIKNLYETKIKP